MLIKFIILLILFTGFNYTFADVKGDSGTIRFDSNSDRNPEMILNSTGLGIGITPTANLHVSSNAILSGDLKIGGATQSSI